MRDLTDQRRRRGAISCQLDCPEGALLAWLIGLPDGVDPARAAPTALATAPPSEWDGPRQNRWRALLAEVSRSPADTLPMPPRRRRAGLRC